METCHVSPLPLLSAHPAERGEGVPGSGMGLGAGSTRCLAGATPLSAAPRPVPCAGDAHGDGAWGWGLLPAPAKPLDHALRAFNEAW